MTNYAREFCARERLFGLESATRWMRSRVSASEEVIHQYGDYLTESQIEKVRILYRNGYGIRKISYELNLPENKITDQIHLDIRLGIVPKLSQGEKLRLCAKHRKIRIEA